MLQHSQFKLNEAWILARIDIPLFFADKVADMYVLLDACSGFVFGQLVYENQLPSAAEFSALLKRARKTKMSWPKKIFIPKDDPAIEIMQPIVNHVHLTLEIIPAPHLEKILDPVSEGLRKFFVKEPQTPEYDLPSGSKPKDLLGDAYDPCPCASGKKYRFCCRPILVQVTEAMCAAQDGLFKEALEWLEKAKAKVGETAEILSRYAIVYSFHSQIEFEKYLGLALDKDPKHPRSHYLLGIHYKGAGDLKKSAAEYELAAKYYPATAKFQLNETLNNLANVYFQLGEYQDAKGAWEKALVFMPHDELTRDNLVTYIYSNSEMAPELRKPSPFVARLLPN